MRMKPGMTLERAWSFVTVTYNSADTLVRCWNTHRSELVRWIVVDNASTDETVLVAEELGAEVIRLKVNQGFSAANNVGLERSCSEYVGFVNPDVVVDYDSLGTVSTILDESDVLVAPQLLNTDGSRQPSARGFPYLVDKFAHRGVRLPGADLGRYLPQPTKPTYVAWAMGAAIAGRRTTFLRLGGWDAKFFLYYEDHDLGLRAWDAGVPVVAVPDALWVHEWARETTQRHAAPWRRELRSALRFFGRYPEFLLPFPGPVRRRHPRLAKHYNRPYSTGEVDA
jgi:N-acetylglucosaminyl-diphospho-decaprenol L-rhamnosyltransferase